MPISQMHLETDEVTDAAVMLSVHSQGTHATPGVATATPSVTSNTKLEKVRRPTVSAAGSSEDWSYFLTRWDDYFARPT